MTFICISEKQLEKYKESWAVFKFYLDSFLLGSKPDQMPAAHAGFTRSTPEEANRNRAMFMDFVTELHRTAGITLTSLPHTELILSFIITF